MASRVVLDPLTVGSDTVDAAWWKDVRALPSSHPRSMLSFKVRIQECFYTVSMPPRYGKIYDLIRMKDASILRCFSLCMYVAENINYGLTYVYTAEDTSEVKRGLGFTACGTCNRACPRFGSQPYSGDRNAYKHLHLKASRIAGTWLSMVGNGRCNSNQVFGLI